MRTEETIVNIMLDPGKGRVTPSGREGIVGQPYGVLPTPTRKGYRFAGWYLNETEITPETLLKGDADVRLEARWQKDSGARSLKSSMLHRQRTAAVVLAAVAVLLAIALAIVGQLITIYTLTDTYVVNGETVEDRYYIKKKDNGAYALFDRKGNLMDTNGQDADVFIAPGSGNQYQIDPETGACTVYAVVETEGSESVGYNNRVLIFPQIQQEKIYSIKVSNAEGEYAFYHDGYGSVYIDGYKESALEYDATLYAYLCVSCGFPLSSKRLDLFSEESVAPKLPDGSVDYAAYGLDAPQAEFVITGVKWGYDKNGKEVIESDNAGNYLPDPEKTYTIQVGDKAPSEAGYYVRMPGREAVYILSSDLAKTVLQPIEALVTPLAVAPVNVTVHSMAKNFILAELGEWTDEGDIEINDENLIAAFTYQENDYRIDTMLETAPYLCEMPLMGGYTINDANVSTVLGLFYNMQYVGCKKLGLDYESLREYGLDRDVYYLTYRTSTQKYNEAGEEIYHVNRLLIGKNKTEDGTYYVASFYYDMIVEVDQYYLSFLEWDTIDWYESFLFRNNIAYVRDLHFSFGDRQYDFTLDNTLANAFYLTTNYYTAAGAAVNVAGGTISKRGDIYYYTANGSQTPVAVVKQEVLTQIDLERGSVYTEGEQLYYRHTKTGNVYPVEVVVDFDTVRVVSAATAEANPSLENIVYVYEGVDADDNTVRETRYRYREGVEAVLSLDTNNLYVYCDQYTGGKTESTLLDYSFTHSYIGDTGTLKSETVTGLGNFRKLYLQLLAFTLQGDVDEKEFKERTGKTVAEFLADADTEEYGNISYYLEDYAHFFNDSTEGGEYVYQDNNKRSVVIRFYRYTDLKSLVTVELLEQNAEGEWVSSGDGVVGKFYVLTSYLDKLLGNAQNVLDQVPVK